ncbi:PadR family transcriptional regulator (plasmid) [Priestia megaterium]|uniref:PadR family transcriptional regulator n=1 Tax=Priestia megaterium TaxID=1404 RepID=UPI00196A8148|nr:PadR family transcriptional regulator [Priestia megaterium]QSF36341.1 PadR family transcriptional regulator [Priestia megaterium]
MNTLGYAILGALARQPCSGYELAQYLEVIWPAKHSQIYPLLTKMEQNELLIFEYVEQFGKPNKKIFSITEKGRKQLKDWITKTPTHPIIRDEFLIKVYSIWFSDKENAHKLIKDRISNLEQRTNLQEEKISNFKGEYGESGLSANSKHFGRYILYNRTLRLQKEELSWCKWVLDLLQTTKLNNFLLGIISIKSFHKLILETIPFI